LLIIGPVSISFVVMAVFRIKVLVCFLVFLEGAKSFQHSTTHGSTIQMKLESAPKLDPSSKQESSTPRVPIKSAYDWRTSPNKWGRGIPIEPGFGGPWPGDPNAPTFNVKVRNVDTGEEVEMDVPVDRYIYFAFEDAGIELPLINKERACRNGCCTTCAVKTKEGKMKMDPQLGLLKEMKKQGYGLLCCSYPRSDLVVEVQKEDEVYRKQWGDTFESGGVEWGGFLPEDD